MSISDFTKRQNYVNQLQEKVTENVATIDKFMKKTKEQFEELIQACEDRKKKVMTELQELRQELISRVSAAVETIETKRYEVNYEARTRLEELVLTGYLTTPSQEFSLFSGAIQIEPLIDEVSKVGRYSINPDIYLQERIEKIPVIKKNRIWLFNVPSLERKEFTLRQSTNIDASTAYCFLDSNTLICCGGANLPDVYEINLSSFEVAKLQNMSCSRKYAGICKFGDWVFIFGGQNGADFLASAEKYSLKLKVWNLLPNQMAQSKWACTASKHLAEVYITGYNESSRKTSVEVFNPDTQIFIPIYTTPAFGLWPFSLIVNEELLIIVHDKLFKSNLRSNKTLFSVYNTQSVGHVWSNCPAIEFQGEFYTLKNSAGAISGILKVNPIRNELKLATSFKY